MKPSLGLGWLRASLAMTVNIFAYLLISPVDNIKIELWKLAKDSVKL